MSDFGFPSQPSQFSRALRDCRELYLSSGHDCIRQCPELLRQGPAEFAQLMDDLHRALVTKVYFAVCQADRVWSKQERFLAEILFHHLFDCWLSGAELQQAAKDASERSGQLKWYSLVRPFDRLPLLRDRVGQLETLVMRLANIIARADGELAPQESAMIQTIQQELHQHLRSIPIDQPDRHQEAESEARQAIELLRAEAAEIYRASHLPNAPEGPSQATPLVAPKPAEPPQLAGAQDSGPPPTPPVTLADALGELDRLIGLERIKEEVRTLTNLLRLQQRRTEVGLPETEVSLHMVFNGNPGTGKTTVARIIGKIFGAMGILAKGHLVETDRSGLVAEYAGQTGPKTNKKVDEALDGVLFIDEAYSLIAEAGEDPFGREAIQALLKRAEDDRHRLVVILAGYPREMRALLLSNPGLSSRFGRELYFEDYGPVELARIFELMCQKSRYEMTTQARARLLMGTHWWYDNRDRHFGNGRAVRNLFEDAVRHLANRIASLAEINKEQLSLLEAEDLAFPEVPAGVFDLLTGGKVRFHIECPQCGHAKDIPPEFLARTLRCPKCEHDFTPCWGEVVPGPAAAAVTPTSLPADPPDIGKGVEGEPVEVSSADAPVSNPRVKSDKASDTA